MEAATPYTVTVMQANVQGDIYSFQPCFLVDKGKERVGRWFVQLTGSAAAVAGARLDADTETLHEAMLRVGLDRLERELASPGGEQRLFGQNATQDCKFTADDLDELLGPSTTDKACGYRHAEGRDLYCTAADRGDESVIGSIGHRRAAPTSRPICNDCSLPDGRTLCSELAHPRVSAVETLGGYSRFLGSAWCNAGQPEIQDASQCSAGGHACWKRTIGEPTPFPLPQVSPLTLPEALDFLDAIWRLAFGKKRRLLRPSTFTDAAGLVGKAESPEQFETCISDLADSLDRITIADDLLPPGEAGQSVEGSLNRMKVVLNQHDSIDESVVDRAIATLQKVRGLRHTHAHSGAAGDRPRILRELGLAEFASDWQRLWDGLRVRTVEALLALRTQVGHLTEDGADSPAGSAPSQGPQRV